jgi:hypothetical protein
MGDKEPKLPFNTTTVLKLTEKILFLDTLNPRNLLLTPLLNFYFTQGRYVWGHVVQRLTRGGGATIPLTIHIRTDFFPGDQAPL